MMSRASSSSASLGNFAVLVERNSKVRLTCRLMMDSFCENSHSPLIFDFLLFCQMSMPLIVAFVVMMVPSRLALYISLL
jgi:hypothetical protein